MRREIADVLETAKRAKDRDKGCTLLIERHALISHYINNARLNWAGQQPKPNIKRSV